jgi:hypothetical protein
LVGVGWNGQVELKHTLSFVMDNNLVVLEKTSHLLLLVNCQGEIYAEKEAIINKRRGNVKISSPILVR